MGPTQFQHCCASLGLLENGQNPAVRKSRILQGSPLGVISRKFSLLADPVLREYCRDRFCAEVPPPEVN
jgi:hypothetical protein